MKSGLSPIVLFVYKRPSHTLQTLNALMQNELADQSVLYIYADGPKVDADKETLHKINETRQIIKGTQWCKEVIIYEKETNSGLADSIINGVTEIVNKYGSVIVLEDDIISSKTFLTYMNEALARYENENRIMQVSGHMFPISIKASEKAILLPLTTSWGWGTWQRAWTQFDPFAKGYGALKENKSLSFKFDLDGSYPYTKMLIQQMEENTLSSWAIRWWWTVFEKNGLGLFPDKSLIQNIGFDGSGVHSGSKNLFKDPNWITSYRIKNFPCLIDVNITEYLILKKYFASSAIEGKSNDILKFFLKAKRRLFPNR